jgi:hypothetical protein
MGARTGRRFRASVGASGQQAVTRWERGLNAGLARTVALILLFLTEPVQYLPRQCSEPSSQAGWGSSPAAWRALAAVDSVEVAIASVTTGCVVVFGVLEALVVAVGLSIIDTVRRSARPHDAVLGWVERLGRYGDVALHPSARLTPGLVVYRLDDRLFFANARYFKARVLEALRAAPTPARWLVFDAEAVTHIDATGLEALLVGLVKDFAVRGSLSSSRDFGRGCRSSSRAPAWLTWSAPGTSTRPFVRPWRRSRGLARRDLAARPPARLALRQPAWQLFHLRPEPHVHGSLRGRRASSSE